MYIECKNIYATSVPSTLKVITIIVMVICITCIYIHSFVLLVNTVFVQLHFAEEKKTHKIHISLYKYPAFFTVSG